jgi:hypothetical protein
MQFWEPSAGLPSRHTSPTGISHDVTYHRARWARWLVGTLDSFIVQTLAQAVPLQYLVNRSCQFIKPSVTGLEKMTGHVILFFVTLSVMVVIGALVQWRQFWHIRGPPRAGLVKHWAHCHNLTGLKAWDMKDLWQKSRYYLTPFESGGTG